MTVKFNNKKDSLNMGQPVDSGLDRDQTSRPGVSATDGCAELTTLPTSDHRAQQADMGLGNPTPGRLGRSLTPPPLTL